MPCEAGEIELPLWARVITELDDQPVTLNTLGRAIGGRRDCAERNQTIRERYARGESQYQLAEAYGLTRSTVEKIVQQGGRNEVAEVYI